VSVLSQNGIVVGYGVGVFNGGFAPPPQGSIGATGYQGYRLPRESAKYL